MRRAIATPGTVTLPRDLRSSSQCSEIKAAAVGALPAGHPVIVCLVGKAPVLDEPIAVLVVLAQVLHRHLHGIPGVAEKISVFGAAEDIVAPYHQHVFAVQIAPVGNILIVVLIHVDERIFCRGSQIMRGRAGGLACHELKRVLVIALPRPHVLLRIALGDRVGVLPHLLLLNLRPEFHQWE